MRSMAVLCASVALITAGSAGAQAPGAPFPAPGMRVNHPPMPPAPRTDRGMQPRHNLRWGSQVGGRWWGGVNAPGGWAAYRQPYRGYRVPRYWVAPRFFVTDWNHYGLYAPTGGYNWVRYYDDAILVDGRGEVSDWRGGLDWDAYDRSDDGDYAYEERRGSDGAANGLGGAVAGAVVGGVAGNVIAGRGNRLGGTLIGAGVGATAGYALDRAASDRRDGPRPRDGWRGEPIGPGNPPPPNREVRRIIIHRDGGAGYPPAGPPPGAPYGPSRWVSPDGGTTVVTTTTSGGGAPVIVTAPYGGVTTVTIQSAPVVTTTTTTEVIEDSVTYTRPARRVVRQRVWHRPTKLIRRPSCACGS